MLATLVNYIITLAVTRRDGSSLHLTDQELSDGWWTKEIAKVFQGTSWGPPEYRDDWKVAYSPRVASIHGLPHETRERCAGYDEWYVFKQEVAAGEIEAFVNWVGFRLNDPVYLWCTDRFWQQMDRLTPESYIADATLLTFVTRNRALFTNVLAAFAADDN